MSSAPSSKTSFNAEKSSLLIPHAQAGHTTSCDSPMVIHTINSQLDTYRMSKNDNGNKFDTKLTLLRKMPCYAESFGVPIDDLIT